MIKKRIRIPKELEIPLRGGMPNRTGKHFIEKEVPFRDRTNFLEGFPAHTSMEQKLNKMVNAYNDIKVSQEEQLSTAVYQTARDVRNNKYALSKHSGFFYKNKEVWSGVVNLLDGMIEKVYTYEEAATSSFRHALYVSPSNLEKIKDEEALIFWINKDKQFISAWDMVELDYTLIQQIKKQLEVS